MPVEMLTLREFEQRHAELRDYLTEVLAREREAREQVEEERESSRKTQATETLRRLDELNHAHRAAMENWARSLPRELFDQWKVEHDKWRESVNSALTMMAPTTQTLAQLHARVDAIERLANKVSGALTFIGMMGIAGVLGLILGLARLAGWAP